MAITMKIIIARAPPIISTSKLFVAEGEDQRTTTHCHNHAQLSLAVCL